MALTGPYDTEAEALAACASCCDGAGQTLEAHPALDLAVDAGHVSLAWGGASYAGGVWTLTCAAGVWTLAEGDGEGGTLHTGTATAQACDPFGLVFDGDDFARGADLTVVID